MKLKTSPIALSLLIAVLSCVFSGNSFASKEPLLEDINNKVNTEALLHTIKGMDEHNIQRLIELTEIAAPPFAESMRAQDVAKRLTALGLEKIHIDEVGNVLARRTGKTGKKTIAVVAHIDTVFPIETDVTVRRKGDTFYAPGIGDNTRGLVVLLSLVEVLQKHQITTDADVLFVGSVGEEGLGDLRGVRHLLRHGGPKIDSFIAIDGGRANRLIHQGVGSIRYRVTFSGPGGHSYGAFGRANPHYALAHAITSFTQAAAEVVKGQPKATFSVGRIGGGTSINSIPFASWMEVDLRSVDPKKLKQLDVAFNQSVQTALTAENEHRSSNDPLTVELKSVGQRPAGETKSNSTLVLHASAAMRMAGLEPNLRASSTDANIPMSLGVPAITLSRGGVSKNAHAPNESWQNKNAHQAIFVVLLTVLAEAGVH